MATLVFQNFTSLVSNASAAVQGACATLIDLTVGSVLRAILEANASAALWMQWLVLLVLQASRLNTSTGTDVDSFVNQFLMFRLPATFATGLVTLAPLTPGPSATVLVGDTVRTGDGTQTFSITADPTNPAYSASLGAPVAPSTVPPGGYLLSPGAASLTVPVEAQTAGTPGNVLAGAISLLGTAIAGIDTVTNAVAFTNGVDAESDSAVQARFPVYINSLSRATQSAIEAAIAAVQQGLTSSIAANVDAQGNSLPGNFIVTIDDGSGFPSANLKGNVFAAVDSVRALCESFSVQSPVVLDASVTFTITALASIKPALIGPAEQAVTAYIDSLPIGSPLAITQIARVVYNTSASITNVSAVLVNGSGADITVGPSGVIKATSVIAS
jgi:uncharacterized phage protein gp47/JayE